MAVRIHNSNGYMGLTVWVLNNVIQLATESFCDRFLNMHNDPCGRQRDQMVQAARSAVANIAEGSSRHQTSTETEMKLHDVARASITELKGDYFNFLLYHGEKPWAKDSKEYKYVTNIECDKPTLKNDWDVEAAECILDMRQRFAHAIENEDPIKAAKSLLILCNRSIALLEKMIQQEFEDFRQQGGFREGLTELRLAAKAEAQHTEGAPPCPQCHAPMVLKTISRGSRLGDQFWGCSQWHKTGCEGKLPYKKNKTI